MIASLYIGNVLPLVLNLPLAEVGVKLLAIPRPWLYGGYQPWQEFAAFLKAEQTKVETTLKDIGLVR